MFFKKIKIFLKNIGFYTLKFHFFSFNICNKRARARARAVTIFLTFGVLLGSFWATQIVFLDAALSNDGFFKKKGGPLNRFLFCTVKKFLKSVFLKFLGGSNHLGVQFKRGRLTNSAGHPALSWNSAPQNARS